MQLQQNKRVRDADVREMGEGSKRDRSHLAFTPERDDQRNDIDLLYAFNRAMKASL